MVMLSLVPLILQSGKLSPDHCNITVTMSMTSWKKLDKRAKMHAGYDLSQLTCPNMLAFPGHGDKIFLTTTPMQYSC